MMKLNFSCNLPFKKLQWSSQVLEGFTFFLTLIVKTMGVAFLQVRLVHECLLYLCLA